MKEVWFVTASQHLYGEETLKEVKVNSEKIVENLRSKTDRNIKFKALATTKEQINEIFNQINYDDNCIGVIVYAHTFSPAKMWVNAFKNLRKPLLHMHTQLNKVIPCKDIDMDYMNLHQSAHGDRELAFGMNAANLKRTTVVGHYQNQKVVTKIKKWYDSVKAIDKSRRLRIIRFGDNMNNVAVTDGNKVLAEKELGWTIHTVGIGDLVTYVEQITDAEVDELMAEYDRLYKYAENCKVGQKMHKNVRYQAKLELAIEKYLVKNNYQAFTTNFDILHGLEQLPGLAAQRLMAKGYGFAGEGDWRTSAMVYLMKQMSNNMQTSFMEDYTYDYEQGLILEAHMLEICPSIAESRPKIEVHPLSIGGKSDPARLTFCGQSADGIAVSLVENNGKYRMLINTVEVMPAPYEMPKLPVAATFWWPKPNLEVSAHCWLIAGGAHHTVYSAMVDIEQIDVFTKYYNIETILIDENTKIRQFEKELM